MPFEPPTYEEYQKATGMAKFRYKYGLTVMILCWICLLFIIYYMVTNAELLAANPLQYGADKMNLVCHCSGNAESNKWIDFYINGSGQWLPEQPRDARFDSLPNITAIWTNLTGG